MLVISQMKEIHLENLGMPFTLSLKDVVGGIPM